MQSAPHKCGKQLLQKLLPLFVFVTSEPLAAERWHAQAIVTGTAAPVAFGHVQKHSAGRLLRLPVSVTLKAFASLSLCPIRVHTDTVTDTTTGHLRNVVATKPLSPLGQSSIPLCSILCPMCLGLARTVRMLRM
jgi:hypothetical protein